MLSIAACLRALSESIQAAKAVYSHPSGVHGHGPAKVLLLFPLRGMTALRLPAFSQLSLVTPYGLNAPAGEGLTSSLLPPAAHQTMNACQTCITPAMQCQGHPCMVGTHNSRDAISTWQTCIILAMHCPSISLCPTCITFRMHNLNLIKLLCQGIPLPRPLPAESLPPLSRPLPLPLLPWAVAFSPSSSPGASALAAV